MSTAIILNFVNQTGDIPSADVVICQHNARAGMRANPVAWQVLRNIGYGGNRRFEIPPDLEFSAQDGDGNTLPRCSVEQGQVFGIGQDASDQMLQALPDTASAQKHLELRNYLAAGTVTANVFRSGKLLAAISDIAPRETAAFQFHPHVYVGLAAQAQEGEVLSIAAASMITTRLNLLGVRSADIVMTSSGKNASCPTSVWRISDAEGVRTMAEPNGGAMKGGHVSQFWKSGSVRGYNGDGIAITLLYDVPEGTDGPDFVDLRFADNSVRKDGPVARIRRFSPENTQWTDIPLPDPEGTIGEGVNEDFSIQGQFRFEARSPGRLLRVRFHWGAGQVHSEEGYVLMLKQ